MRSAEEFNAVRRLIAAGLNDCAIARQTRHTATDRARLAAPTARARHEARRLGSRAESTTTSPHFPQRHTPTCSACISATAASRACTPRLAPPRRAGREVPGDHRALPRGNRHADAQSARRRHATARRAASTCRSTQNTGRVCFPQHGPGKKHTAARSRSNLGSKRSSTRPPKSSSSA